MTTNNEIRIGLLGLGAIGTGVARLLQEHENMLSAKLGMGKKLRLVRACDRDLLRDRKLDLNRLELTRNVQDIIAADDIDIVIELFGGYEPARSFVLEAMKNGKHVVTANKALIAKHGEEVFAQANANNLAVGFEAAVGGGIPCLKAVREGLAGNCIESVYGILNGTCNYILTQMEERGLAFDDVLVKAQELGYAEADPTFDIEGLDTAHKLAILAAMSFGSHIRFADVYAEGITRISADDIQAAAEMGFRIKLLGIAKRHDKEDGSSIEMRVHPTLVPQHTPLAEVSDSYNAVFISGDFIENTFYFGRGAGERPTASAVVADVMDIARCLPDGIQYLAPPMGLPHIARREISTLPMADVSSEYYLRLMVRDESGVLARITEILAHQRISLEAVQQKQRHSHDAVPIIMITHETMEGNLQTAVERITQLDCVEGQPLILRIERFGTGE
ncbi:MAG: homoserine dehydrogenase [Mariprofundales bacterium]